MLNDLQHSLSFLEDPRCFSILLDDLRHSSRFLDGAHSNQVDGGKSWADDAADDKDAVVVEKTVLTGVVDNLPRAWKWS